MQSTHSGSCEKTKMVIPTKPIQKFSELSFIENRDGGCLQEEEMGGCGWLLAELQKMQRP